MAATIIKAILMCILVALAIIGLFALFAIAAIYQDEIERQSNNQSE